MQLRDLLTYVDLKTRGLDAETYGPYAVVQLLEHMNKGDWRELMAEMKRASELLDSEKLAAEIQAQADKAIWDKAMAEATKILKQARA